MANASREYFFWADLVRIAAILLVVLLHTFTVSEATIHSTFFTIAVLVFAKTCVPLFVMLSGALLLSKQEPWQLFFKKRLQRVLIPWITWTMVFFLVTSAGSLNSPVRALIELKDVFTAYFTFLPLIFCLYLLIPLCRLIVNRGGLIYTAYMLVLWFLAVSLLPYIRNTMAFPLHVDNGLVTRTIQFSGYLVAGWLLSKIVVTKKITYIFLVGLILVTIVWATWLVRATNTINLTFSAYHSPWLVVSSMGLFVLFANGEKLFQKLFKKNINTIRALSRASFGVFLIHDFVNQTLHRFSLIQIDVHFMSDLGNWALVSLVSYSIILILSISKKIGKCIT